MLTLKSIILIVQPTPADNNNDVTTTSGPPLRQNSSEGGIKRVGGQKAKEVSVRRNKQTYSMDVGNILKPRNEFGGRWSENRREMTLLAPHLIV
jgi:hypothetical protein